MNSATKEHRKRSKDDFRIFFFLAGQAMGFDTPTRIQYDSCKWLQHGGDGWNDVIGTKAHRGFGKSVMTAAFVAWYLYKNPEHKVMVLCKTYKKACEFIALTRKLLDTMPVCAGMSPRPRGSGFKGDLDREDMFNVATCKVPSKDPSCVAYGIGGAVTGAHVDLLIIDDVETKENTLTAEAREKLYLQISEVINILNPGGRIVVLGTPHNKRSVYVRMEAWVKFRIWPMVYPDKNDQWATTNLAPILLEDLETGKASVGDPTHPERFPQEEVNKKRAALGETQFALQMQLDTRMADEALFPLKIQNLIVHPVDVNLCPAHIVWGTNPIESLIIPGQPTGMANAPIMFSKEQWIEYDRKICYLDPAGDETDANCELGLTLLFFGGGMLYIPLCTGYRDSASHETLTKVCLLLKAWGVNELWIEDNFGGGLFRKVIAPFVREHCPNVSINGHKVGNQNKFQRICDTLEPVTQGHRLIVDPEVIRDAETAYQFCSVSREPGCLQLVDRLDSMAGAVSLLSEELGFSASEHIERQHEEEKSTYIQDFIATWNNSGNQSQVNTWGGIHQLF